MSSQFETQTGAQKPSPMWAIIPLKDFVQAKQRLSGFLSAAERRRLFHAMVEDTLTVLVECEVFKQVVIVSDDPSASLLAEHYGIEFWSETELLKAYPQQDSGLNAAVRAASEKLTATNVEAMAVIHGDLPLLQAEELQNMAAEHRKLSIATDERGDGTNVLMLSPPSGLDFQYGRASCTLHCQQFDDEWRKENALIHTYTGASRDVDTPNDLVGLVTRDSLLGEHTAYLLEESGIGSRLLTIASGGANSSEGIEPVNDNDAQIKIGLSV